MMSSDVKNQGFFILLKMEPVREKLKSRNGIRMKNFISEKKNHTSRAWIEMLERKKQIYSLVKVNQ